MSKPNDDFVLELKNLFNKYNVENESDTPDYVLAKYITKCLESYAIAVRDRDIFYAFKPWNKYGDKRYIPLERRASPIAEQADYLRRWTNEDIKSWYLA